MSPAVPRSMCFGFFRYGFAFGVGFGRLAVAVVLLLRSLVSRLVLGPLSVAAVSCLGLISRVRHTSTTVLNYLRFKGAVQMSRISRIGVVYIPHLERPPRLPGGAIGRSAPYYTSICVISTVTPRSQPAALKRGVVFAIIFTFILIAPCF